ncbi:histidinol-phosphate phosphatase [Opitutus terrae PB90-1]|uniref:Histidinol-phosphatase n=1 Tax=Opitutus terrae (strain DSM 11246 / JCM 15787 / PB90-1) TaxID=452637 RepID=B1ZQ90_OPITP|nr:histidinol-phosphate phosphatase [Opitutus terrae PB90-1]
MGSAPPRGHARPVDLTPYRDFMVDLARESGDLIRTFYGNPQLAVETKSDLSPVTLADRGAEELMRDRIRQNFPQHGVIGEEFGSDKTDADFVWVLDPIDGTKSFITGVPLFATLIALLHEGQPVLGAIHQPVLSQLLIGDNLSATLNDRPVRCRATTRIEESTLLTSDPLNPAKYRDGARFDALARRARLVRTWGDAYGYLLVATGWADICLDPIMNSWDIAALIPVVRGAGGMITDWQGNAPYPAESTIGSATPELHAQVLAALN